MRARTFLVATGLLVLLAVVRCGDDNLKKYKLLGNLRILALVANQPEVAPGSTVTITPLVSDIGGLGRTLTGVAEACPDPGVSYGANPTCSGVSGAQSITIGGGANFTLTGPEYTGTANTFNVTVPTDLLSGKSTAQSLLGVTYLVTYRLSAAGESQEGFKRIVVSLNPTKNQKPTLTGVLISGSAATVLPGAVASLAPNISAASTETYLTYNTDGSLNTVTETLTTSWFAGRGNIDRTRTESSGTNTYTPSTGPGDVIVMVTRDERGGAAYCIITSSGVNCG